MNPFLNALGFQSAWWICVAGAGSWLEIPALIYCAALMCAHLYWSCHRWQEIKLAALVMSMGIVLDSGLQYFAVIDFHGLSVGPLVPFWLWLLWALLALTLNSSLNFLKTKPLVLSSVLGLVFGPLSYFAGASFGAASVERSSTNFWVLGLAWMLAMPAMVHQAQRILPDDKNPKQRATD